MLHAASSHNALTIPVGTALQAIEFMQRHLSLKTENSLKIEPQPTYPYLAGNYILLVSSGHHYSLDQIKLSVMSALVASC